MNNSRILTFLITIWFTTSGYSQTPTIQGQLGSILKNAHFNGSALVSVNEEILLSAGYGFANHEEQIKNKPTTQHRIGSITKQFTAMAVLILERQGKLNTQSKVGDYVSDVPKAWQGLTVHQLLTHTSGLTHSWSVPAFARNTMKPNSLDDTLELFYERPLLFTPGTDYRYSGVGYFLLAKLIETQSGQSYDDFMRKYIFDPLNMVDTGCDHPEHNRENASQGYQILPNGDRRPARTFHMPLLTGGGNLYSTVDDLRRWDQALRDQRFISKKAYQRLFTPEKRDYAYGWKMRHQGDDHWASHGGGVPEHSSFILRHQTKGICVILMSNHHRKNIQSLAFRLANAVMSTIND